MSGALSHIRILDLSRVLAGPWATQTLADLGAEVIKVERPVMGDDTRQWGPPYAKDARGLDSDQSAYFLCANRNKKSVTLDISTPKGQELLRKMATEVDVIVENFKVGALKRYGLDYASIKKIAPKVIYCSITGFGQTGPYALRPGYDFLMQGLGGLMSITGRADGEDGAGPVKVGVALTDILTGLYASNAILAALASRDKTGLGQQIDIALLDVQVACLANQSMNYLTTGVSPRRMGNSHPNIVPYQDFPTADGDMILAIGNDSQFRKFCSAAGHASLAEDVRFTTNSGRVEHRNILLPLLRKVTVERRTSEWISMLEQEGVPCGPVNDLAGVFADPQVVARQLQLQLSHPIGAVPSIANPIRLSETPVEYRSAPPTLGQHTLEVLGGIFKLSTEEIKELKQQEII